jgi:hypothetical protein
MVFRIGAGKDLPEEGRQGSSRQNKKGSFGQGQTRIFRTEQKRIFRIRADKDLPDTNN